MISKKLTNYILYKEHNYFFFGCLHVVFVWDKNQIKCFWKEKEKNLLKTMLSRENLQTMNDHMQKLLHLKAWISRE